MTDKRINIQKKISFAAILLGIMLITFSRQVQTSIPLSGGTKLIVGVIGSLLTIAGGFYYYRARQHASKNLAEKMANDTSKDDILFLRPFLTDYSLGKTSLSTPPIQGFNYLQTSPEEDLFRALSPLGNLVAIGKPGEKLPVPGALRIYAADEWQQVIIDKLKNSALVILQAGNGEGFNWELQQAFKIVDPTRLMILIFQMSKKNYAQFRELVLQNVNVQLPEKPAFAKGLKTFAAGFFRFKENKEPYFLPLEAPLLRVSPYEPYYARFIYALKPLFEEANVPWTEPKVVKIYLVVFYALGILILLIIAAIIFLG